MSVGYLLQVQLLDLVGQFYASLLQKDDRTLVTSDEEDDKVSSLLVATYNINYENVAKVHSSIHTGIFLRVHEPALYGQKLSTYILSWLYCGTGRVLSQKQGILS